MYIVVDVEADGPCPGVDAYSMVCFGAVLVDNNLDQTFYGKMRPISEKWLPEALAVSGFTREQHETFPPPEATMLDFYKWIQKVVPVGRPIFITDNLAFDWQFINYYFWKYWGRNPFGHSGRRIGDVWAGWKGAMNKSSDWKKFRKTRHSHNPVEDAMGNAEALLRIRDEGVRL